METDDSVPVLTDLVFDFPNLTPSTLGQPLEPIVTFLSPLSITIPSNPASPDEQLDSVSTTQRLSTVCSTTTATNDQSQPPTISSSVGNARSKIISSRKERNRSKQNLRSLQHPANKDNDCRDRLTIARQYKRERFARLATLFFYSPRLSHLASHPQISLHCQHLKKKLRFQRSVYPPKRADTIRGSLPYNTNWQPWAIKPANLNTAILPSFCGKLHQSNLYLSLLDYGI